MDVTAQTVFDLIKYCLYDKDTEPEFLSELNEDNLKSLFNFSKAHDAAHIIGAALKNAGRLADSEYSEKFIKEIDLATYRYFKLNKAFTEIKSVLDREKIDYIPLKGTVLRKYYPEPYLRTSSDIDIFIHTEDVDRAVKAFTETCGYKTVIIGDEHDVSLLTPDGVNLELHYRFVDNLPKAETVLNNVWNVALRDNENSYSYSMPPEYFWLYHTVHIAKHFITGGIGIKPIVDIYFIKNKMNPDTEKVNKLLNDAGLFVFSKEIERIFDIWFNGEKHSELSLKLHKYILLSGTYGTLSHFAVNTRIKDGSKFKTVMRRIFMPYSELKTYYPILSKHPILTPFYQIRRWLRIIFFSRKKVQAEIGHNLRLTDEKTNEFRETLKSLELY